MKTTVEFLSKQIGGKLREKVYTDDALRAMENYAKYYHETEVKKLNIHGVSVKRPCPYCQATMDILAAGVCSGEDKTT